MRTTRAKVHPEWNAIAQLSCKGVQTQMRHFWVDYFHEALPKQIDTYLVKTFLPRCGFTIRLRKLEPRAPKLGGPEIPGARKISRIFVSNYICIFVLVQCTYFYYAEKKISLVNSGVSWWNWPGGLRDFISGWTYRVVALAVFIISGVSSHSSSPNLIKLVIFSCP